MSPHDYYRTHAAEYTNPHADGITDVLGRLGHHLSPRLLDLGCGRGLATQILRPRIGSIVGVDASPDMADLYEKETGHEGHALNFWDTLPPARSAVACYSLHLCLESRVHEVVWRLREAGVTRLVVISPLKRAVRGLGLRELEACSATSRVADNKAVWGWAFEV